MSQLGNVPVGDVPVGGRPSWRVSQLGVVPVRGGASWGKFYLIKHI